MRRALPAAATTRRATLGRSGEALLAVPATRAASTLARSGESGEAALAVPPLMRKRSSRRHGPSSSSSARSTPRASAMRIGADNSMDSISDDESAAAAAAAAPLPVVAPQSPKTRCVDAFVRASRLLSAMELGELQQQLDGAPLQN
jgi:hypothetical protein